MNRFAGISGPSWLDKQSIEQAVRSTEMLGIILAHGQKANLRNLSDDDLDLAGRVGFAVMSEGAESIRACFADMKNAYIGVNRLWGPQFVFGRLYQWLEFKRSSKDPGPIRDLLRDFIFDHFPLPAGKSILGGTLDRRRLYTVMLLAKETDVHPKTLKHFLIAKGALDAAAEEAFMVVDAAIGLEHATTLKTIIMARELPKILNFSRTRIKHIVDAGLIVPIHANQIDDGGHRMKGFARAEVQKFLDRLHAVATEVESPSAGMLTIDDATTEIGCKAIEIVKLIMSGRLARVERPTGQFGLGCLYLDRDELVPLVVRNEGFITMNQAIAITKISNRVANAVFGDIDRAGLVECVAVPKRDGKGVRRMIPVNEFERFRKEFITVGHLSKALNARTRDVARKLEALGGEPVIDRDQCGTQLFRLSSIPHDIIGTA